MKLKEFIEIVTETNKNLDNELTLFKSSDESEILAQFSTLKMDNNRQNEAWSIILDSIGEQMNETEINGFLTIDIVLNLIKNNIALNDLGHLPIKSELLEALYQKDNSCIEALQTVAIRFIYDERVSIERFIEFINKYSNTFLSFYTLYSVIKSDNYKGEALIKCLKLCDILSKNSFNQSIKQYAQKYNNFFMLLTTDKMKEIENAFLSNNILFHWALSKNTNCSYKFDLFYLKESFDYYMKKEILNIWEVFKN